MSRIEQSVDVHVPIRVAYDQWTQFESFPAFMDGVESVSQLDDGHSHWVMRVGNVTREFDTVITEQLPDERVAWKTVGGELKHAGVVTFHRLDDTTTRLMIQVEWVPEGVLERAAGVLNIDAFQVKVDATRFASYVEALPEPTGGWRGTIDRPAP